jgi:hypothetical protein
VTRGSVPDQLDTCSSIRGGHELPACSSSKVHIAMSKLVAIMSMSLDGYVADVNDGVAEVFDWYLNSGNVEFHTGGSDPMTFTTAPTPSSSS